MSLKMRKMVKPTTARELGELINLRSLKLCVSNMQLKHPKDQTLLAYTDIPLRLQNDLGILDTTF